MPRFEHRCHFCNTIIDKAYQPFCNSRCETAAFRKISTKNDKYLKYCPCCGSDFQTTKSNQIYCCSYCQISYKYVKKCNKKGSRVDTARKVRQRQAQVSSAHPPLPINTEDYKRNLLHGEIKLNKEV